MSGYLARLAARAVGMSPPGAPPATGQSVPAFPPSLDHLDTVSDTGPPTGVPIGPPPVETVPPTAPPEAAVAELLPPGAPPDTPDAAPWVPPMPVAVGPSNEADSTAVTIDLEPGDVPVGGASPVAAARPAVQPAVEAAPPVDDEVAMPVSLSQQRDPAPSAMWSIPFQQRRRRHLQPLARWPRCRSQAYPAPQRSIR